MNRFRLFSVEEDGPRMLPLPEAATQFADLYQGLSLGVYTALRTFEHNKFLFLDRHLARTERSMALLGWTYNLDQNRLRQALHEIVTASPWPEMRVRIDVLAAPAELFGTNSRELIAIQPFTPPPPELYETGVAVDFAPRLVRAEPQAKTADFAAVRPATSGLTQLESSGDPTDDGTRPVASYEYLLLDPDCNILEGTGTNFWAVRDGVVYTAGEGVLEGITREILLKLCAQLAIPVRMEAIHRDDVSGLQEAALSGSSRAFLPVVKIAGQTVGNGRPGPVCRRIMKAYQDFVAGHIEPAI